MLTISERELTKLDPSLARPLAQRMRADMDTTQRRDRLLQFWRETVEWEGVRND
jgi:hypothetical protein